MMAVTTARFGELLRRPYTQNFVVGILLFTLPGIYTALTGLGAGGGRSSSADVANKTNAILYALMALVGLLGGTILNTLRPRLSLMVGSIGYPVYVGGLWYYDETGHAWLPLMGGAILGVTSGFLWSAAAYVQFTYAEEKDKALYISTQWSCRSLGAIVGSAISLSMNIDKTQPTGVSNAVYIIFIALHSSAFFIAWAFMVHPSKIVRKDGTHIALFTETRLWTELKESAKVMTDRRFLMLVPAQFVCEMALGLMSSVNSQYFNLRTRSVNNFAYNSIQMFVPMVLICILDSRFIQSRRNRGLLGVSIMGAIAIGAAAGLLGWVLDRRTDRSTARGTMDMADSSWPSMLALYFLFACIHSGYQMCVEYTLSSISNDPSTLARIAGLFKFWSSTGMMVSFLLAGERVGYVIQAGIQLALYVVGTIGVVWVLLFHINESNYFKEENVIAPVAVEESKMLATDCVQDA